MRDIVYHHKNIILILFGIGLYFALTVPFLQNMPITTDEVQFAEPAYNFITHNNFGTTSLSGLFDFQEKTYWQHPFYLMLMYFPIKMFGFNFWSIKILSVFIGLLAVAVAYKIGRSLDMPHLFPAMLTLNVLFIFLAKIGRMEILTLCLSLTTFYFALQKKYLLAGLVSSLALLTHPIGVITVINALTVFIHYRQIDRRYFIGLCLPLTVAVLLLLRDLPEFYRQYFLVQKYLYSVRGLLGGPAAQLSNFDLLVRRAWPWLRWEIPLFGLLVWAVFQKKGDLQRIVGVIIVTNFFGLVLLTPNKYINYYSALVLPYVVLFIAIAIHKNRSLPIILALVFCLLINGVVAGKVAASYMGHENNVLALEMLIKPGAKVLGPPALGVPLKDRQVIGVHVVRMIMDMEGKNAEEVLSELKPNYMVVDSTTVNQQWRLFTSSEEEFRSFLNARTAYCGKTYFNGETIYVFRFL